MARRLGRSWRDRGWLGRDGLGPPGLAHHRRLQPQHASHQPALDQAAGASGEQTRGPQLQSPEGSHGEQQQAPGEKPSLVEPAREHPLAEHPPGRQQQRMLHGMGAHHAACQPAQAGTAELAAEAASRRRTQEPTAADLGLAQPLAQQDVPGPCAAAGRHLGPRQQGVHLRPDPGVQLAAEGSADGGDGHTVQPVVRTQEDDAPPARADQGEEAIPFRQTQERGSGPADQVLGPRVGGLHRLGFEPRSRRRGLDPGSHGSGVPAPRSRRRLGPSLQDTLQAALAGQGMESLAQAVRRPEQRGERIAALHSRSSLRSPATIRSRLQEPLSHRPCRTSCSASTRAR